jgi:SAM-dependent methyltransferase
VTWPSRGSGPGPITPDGCAVDLYALLPPRDEPAIVHAAVPAGAAILELGAGAGRVTRPLAALGHPVVAVDESPQMLARLRATVPPGAPVETVRATIQGLDLGRRFDAVLLGSYLVNVPDDAVRLAFLAACRRHLADGGGVLVQRHAPGWFADAVPFRRTDGAVGFELRDLGRPGPGLLAATIVYQVGERRWTQSFVARRLDDDELAAALAEAGLALDAWLTGDRTWARAVPA